MGSRASARSENARMRAFSRRRSEELWKKQRTQAVAAPKSTPAPPPADGGADAAGTGPPPPPLALPPKATFGALLGAAKMKAAMPLDTLFVLSVSAGALIGLGALLMNNVGGTSPALMAANPGA